MKILLQVFFLIFAGLFGSLLLVEAVFRGATYFSHPVVWSDRPKYYFKAETSQTLQDYSYEKEKKANTFRIAVVGDSYTFAPYMQFTDAFPKVLERMLNLNATPVHAEVINYGVPGYSTSHEIAKAIQAIEEGADLLLLQVTLNDPEIKPYTPTGIRFFDTWGALKVTGWKKSVLDNWKSLAFVITRIHNEITRREYTEYFLKLFNEEKTWKNYDSSTRTLIAKAKAAQVPIVAAIFPLFGMPLDEKYPFFSCHQKAAKLFDELEVPHVDLFSIYKGIPLERLQVIPGGDRHPNEIAHRMAAEALYDWLLSLQLLPSDLHIRQRFQGRTQIIKEKPYTGEEVPLAKEKSFL